MCAWECEPVLECEPAPVRECASARETVSLCVCKRAAETELNVDFKQMGFIPYLRGKCVFVDGCRSEALSLNRHCLPLYQAGHFEQLGNNAREAHFTQRTVLKSESSFITPAFPARNSRAARITVMIVP